MNPTRLLSLVLAGCCCLALAPLSAQVTASPLALIQQYNADTVITTKDGTTLTNKVYMDNGKIRSEVTTNGMQMISIIRPDEQKVYSVLPLQKMVMEMPYDPAKVKQQLQMTATKDGKFELVGPDLVDGVACTKYKMTNSDNKVFFMWVDTAKNVPVKMAADDGSFTMTWKNYQPGPQDPALFEPPVGYQVMPMPGIPGMPGGQ